MNDVEIFLWIASTAQGIANQAKLKLARGWRYHALNENLGFAGIYRTNFQSATRVTPDLSSLDHRGTARVTPAV